MEMIATHGSEDDNHWFLHTDARLDKNSKQTHTLEISASR